MTNQQAGSEVTLVSTDNMQASDRFKQIELIFKHLQLEDRVLSEDELSNYVKMEV